MPGPGSLGEEKGCLNFLSSSRRSGIGSDSTHCRTGTWGMRWSTKRPWTAPENLGEPHDYKHPSVVFPPCYNTNHTAVPVVQVMNAGTPPVINFNDVPTGETTVRAAVFRVYGCGPVTIRVKAGTWPTTPFSVLQPPSGSDTVHSSPETPGSSFTCARSSLPNRPLGRMNA